MGENMKNSILRSKILILQLALYLISITMSKAKHPANMALLTFTKFCAYLPHYERDWIGNSMAFKPIEL